VAIIRRVSRSPSPFFRAPISLEPLTKKHKKLMSEALYFRITLEPHLKHSGDRTGRRISFLAEVPLDFAKAEARFSDDEDAVFQEAKRLAAALTCRAMTGRPHQPGEDEMRISFHSIPQMTWDLTARRADAEKDGVRVWLLGADVD
jgi:hypothetical protein